MFIRIILDETLTRKWKATLTRGWTSDLGNDQQCDGQDQVGNIGGEELEVVDLGCFVELVGWYGQ